jgi:nitrate/nitrite sensing protein/histidine kinase/DNA gyrase B/HSP90-like ATPase/HAMP domain-containing protein
VQTRPVTPRRDATQAGARAGRPGGPERRRPTQPADPAPAAPPAKNPGLFSIRSWRVRNRLTLLVLLPLIAAVSLAAARINTLYQDRQHFQNVQFQAKTAETVEALLLVLQQEREAASVCLAVMSPCNMAAAGGDANDQALVTAFTTATQATLTVQDQLRAAALQVINGSSYSSTLRGLAQEADGRAANDLPQIRIVVGQKSVPFTVAYNAYSGIINDVIGVLAAGTAGTSDATVSQDGSALTAIASMIEAQAVSQLFTEQVIAGQGPIGEATLQQQQVTALNQAVAAGSAAQDTFDKASTPSLLQSFQATVSGPEVASAQAAVSTALQILQGQIRYDQSQFPNDATVVRDESLPVTIGDLRTVQATATQQLEADTQSLLNNSQSDLYKNAAMIILALILSFAGIVLVARSLVGPLHALRTGALDIAANRLPEVVRRLRDADAFDAESAVDPIPITSNDEIGQVARAFDEVHMQAVRLASEQALLRSNVNSMFVNLSRRSQSLVQRQLRLIDELENSEQDPDQLANLFKLDHLATRMRRNGENLLVLAGEEPGRKWSQAVRLLDVMRAGASEVEQYERVALRDLPDVNVLGRVVNDLVHLVAELLENATSFSAPETKVSVTANMLNTGGVMLEIEDAGIGMTPEELDDANERLANPPVIDVAISRRMGLYVVGRLATRHGIQVRLRRSAGGGITALVLVPSTLLAGADGQQQAPTPELSATGARSLGALPRRPGGQLGFPAQPDGPDALPNLGGERASFPSEGTAAPPYRGSAPAALSNGDQFAGDVPPFGGAPARPMTGPGEELPRRPDPASRPEGARNEAAPAAPPTIPGARTPFEDRERPSGAPLRPDGPPRGDTGQFPRIQDPASTGQFPPARPPFGQDAPPAGPAPASPLPTSPDFPTGEFPIPDFPPFPGPGVDESMGSSGRFQIPPGAPRPEPGHARPAEPAPPAAPAQFNPPAPRPADSSSTGQLPRIQDPVGRAPAPAPAEPLGPLPPAQFQPPAPQLPPPPPQPTAVERLFAQDPLPPAPVTDERLPIFEAMESEWFRRRDEARAQAAMARPTGPSAAPAPVAASAPTPTPAADAAPATPALRQISTPTPQVAVPLASSVAPPVSESTAPAPAAPAPSPVSAPRSEQTPPAAPAPAQSLPTAPAAPEPPTANSGGVKRMDNTGAWSSPGDEGWKAAQAAAKPVAAGLTQKGLPKRVPRSNLVPGSAGGIGAAKATPPPIPPRSADAVRGRLSSFHQGLRQGRDAAQGGEGEPGGTDAAGSDGKGA